MDWWVWLLLIQSGILGLHDTYNLLPATCKFPTATLQFPTFYLQSTCYLQFHTCYLQFSYLLLTISYLLLATCNFLPATCNLQSSTCYLQPPTCCAIVTCNLQPALCYLHVLPTIWDLQFPILLNSLKNCFMLKCSCLLVRTLLYYFSKCIIYKPSRNTQFEMSCSGEKGSFVEGIVEKKRWLWKK